MAVRGIRTLDAATNRILYRAPSALGHLTDLFLGKEWRARKDSNLRPPGS